VLRQHRQKIAAIELEYLRVLMSHRRSRARTAVKRRYLAEDIATAKEVQNDLASISRYVADFHAARHDKEQAVGMVSSLEQRGPLRVAPELTRLHQGVDSVRWQAADKRVGNDEAANRVRLRFLGIHGEASTLASWFILGTPAMGPRR